MVLRITLTCGQEANDQDSSRGLPLGRSKPSSVVLSSTYSPVKQPPTAALCVPPATSLQMSTKAGVGSSSSSSSTPVKRACDSCHRRKVKCIGQDQQPCKNCLTAGLACTYNSIPQKKGPKGSRAKVLSELRETQQRHSNIAPNSYDHGAGARPVSPAQTKTPGLLTLEVINACLEYYFANLYSIQPILHQERVQRSIMAMDDSIEAYCSLAAMCAYVLMQPQMVLPPNVAARNGSGATSNLQLAHLLLEESIRVRRGYEYIEDPTLRAIYTSFFIFQCYYYLDKQKTAWSYLRQASTLAIIMGMHDEETYKTGEIAEVSRKRRLFWLLFITERAYAFKQHRPLSLYATIRLPSAEDDPSDNVPLSGFVKLINLYKPFDETFFGLWNQTRDGAVPSWLIQLQEQLSNVLPAYLEGTEVQAVDIRMSQLWLKTMIWQLAISHGFISSMSNDNTLSFQYPTEISRNIVELSREFSQNAMEIHGIGLVEKLFDIACTLTDVIALGPQTLPQPNNYDMAPREYLNRIIELISTLRGGQSRHLPVLVGKVTTALPGHTLPSSIAQRFQADPRSGPYYESSGGSASHEASPYDSPPTQGQQNTGSLNLQPGPSHSSVMADQNSNYPGHYEGNASNVQGMRIHMNYSLYGPSMDYPELSTSGAPSSQNTQDSATGIYSGHLPSGTQGVGGRGGGGGGGGGAGGYSE